MRTLSRTLTILSTAVALAAPALGQTPDPDLPTLLELVRERVKQTYIDLQKLAWTQTVREETLKEDRTQKEKPRESVYDMIIRLQPAVPGDSGPPFYIRAQRDLKLVDGKPVKKKTEPVADNSGNMGSLLFLLVTGDRAADYTFSYAGQGDLEGRRTLMVDISYPQKVEPRVVRDFDIFRVRSEFQITGVVFNEGRLWIDPDTYDVLRLDSRSNPFEFSGGFMGKDKRTYAIEMTNRFKSMTFADPSQTLVVPESMEHIATMKGGKNPVIRTFYSFSDFKRFTGDVQITPLAK